MGVNYWKRVNPKKDSLFTVAHETRLATVVVVAVIYTTTGFG